MVDATCDINDLMKVVNTDELMKTSFVEDVSQAEDAKAQSDTKSDRSECELEFSFEVTKENIH
jgi:hypothetical protein